MTSPSRTPNRLPPRPSRAAFLASFRHAFDGIAHAMRTQRNMRIHAAATVAVVVSGVALSFDRGEWIAVIVMIALVLSLELVNTAIEAIVDLASPRHHRLAKVAKDAAAGAVLVAAVGSLAVAVLIASRRLG